MGLFHCKHAWGFPRRWPEFEGRRNVDVQTCVKCGARRLSEVQFGTAPDVPAEPARQRWSWGLTRENRAGTKEGVAS